MKIAIVADKKSGHLSQSLGLREIIKEYSRKKDIFVLEYIYVIRDVAQLGSASALGAGCRRFKSCHPELVTILFIVKVLQYNL